MTCYNCRGKNTNTITEFNSESGEKDNFIICADCTAKFYKPPSISIANLKAELQDWLKIFLIDFSQNETKNQLWAKIQDYKGY